MRVTTVSLTFVTILLGATSALPLARSPSVSVSVSRTSGSASSSGRSFSFSRPSIPVTTVGRSGRGRSAAGNAVDSTIRRVSQDVYELPEDSIDSMPHQSMDAASSESEGKPTSPEGAPEDAVEAAPDEGGKKKLGKARAVTEAPEDATN